MYDNLETSFLETGGKVMVDFTFKLGSRDFLVKSSHDVGDGDCDDILVNTATISVRQLSEWGMRIIQAQSLRLKDPLPIHDGIERRIILRLMAHFLISIFTGWY